MPDASRAPHTPGWSEVFRALPLEAPDASSWPTLAAGTDFMPAAERSSARVIAAGDDHYRTPRTPWVLAATLAAIAILSTFWLLHDRTGRHEGAEQLARQPTTARPLPISESRIDSTHPGSEPGPRMTAAPDLRASARLIDHAADSAIPHAIPATVTGTTARDSIDRVRPSPRLEATNQVSAIALDPPDTDLAAAHLIRADETGGDMRGASQADERDSAPASSDLERLYDLSAQLETLLALARDPRVESGPAAALSSELDAALVAIDARLSLPDLPAEDRVSLWQARVDTLQQAASFEGHQRLLAAQGQRLDGMLVDID